MLPACSLNTHRVPFECSLGACAEVKDFVGSTASDLHRRKFEKYDALVSYLKAHKKETRCPCSRAMLQYYPSRDMRFATEEQEQGSYGILWCALHTRSPISESTWLDFSERIRVGFIGQIGIEPSSV